MVTILLASSVVSDTVEVVNVIIKVAEVESPFIGGPVAAEVDPLIIGGSEVAEVESSVTVGPEVVSFMVGDLAIEVRFPTVVGMMVVGILISYAMQVKLDTGEQVTFEQLQL